MGAALGLGLTMAVTVMLCLSIQGLGERAGATVGFQVLASPANDPTRVEVDLEHETYVAPSLVYNGYLNTNDRAFPVLLIGAAAHRFWPHTRSILELAPPLPATTQGHDTGLLLFRATGAPSMTLHALGAFTLDGVGGGASGDGLEAYFFLTPPRVGNWNTPYYATNPEGANGTFLLPQGDVMFPYSTTPYVAVQWDPAYQDRIAFNLYVVHPESNGSVRVSDILGAGPIGRPTSALPSAHQPLWFNATYSVKTNVLTAEVSDERNPGVHYRIRANLSAYGFARPDAGKLGSSHYYFGLGGSGNYPTGWGLHYLSLSESSGPSRHLSAGGVSEFSSLFPPSVPRSRLR
jgi:hypothetical protein